MLTVVLKGSNLVDILGNQSSANRNLQEAMWNVQTIWWQRVLPVKKGRCHSLLHTKKILVSQYYTLLLILHWRNPKKASSAIKPEVAENWHCIRECLGFTPQLVCSLFQRRPSLPDWLSSGWRSILPGPGRSDHWTHTALHTCGCFQYLQCHASESYEFSAHTKSDTLACSDSEVSSAAWWQPHVDVDCPISVFSGWPASRLIRVKVSEHSLAMQHSSISPQVFQCILDIRYSAYW